MVSTFEALVEPRRREILDLLRAGERPVGELVRDLRPLTQPTVSKHLRVLREVGLVEVRQDAQRRLYRLRPEPLAEVDAWLAPYRRFWSDALDVLGRHLDTMPDPVIPGGVAAGSAVEDASGPGAADLGAGGVAGVAEVEVTGVSRAEGGRVEGSADIGATDSATGGAADSVAGPGAEAGTGARSARSFGKRGRRA